MKKLFKRLIDFITKSFKGNKPETTSADKTAYDIETDEHLIVQDDIDIEEWNAGEPVSNDDTVTPEPAVFDDEILTYGAGTQEGKYFSISELCASATAKAKGIKNVPDDTQRKHLTELIVNLLDPIREAWGEYCTRNGWQTKGITVTSGFRCPKLNKAVGGVSNSAHLVGYAADTKPSNGRQADYERFIREWVAGHPAIAFDQIIIERSRTARWVHIAIRNQQGRQRRQCFSLKT